MHAGTETTYAVKNGDDLAACFDATCAEVFATSCHLVAGDRDRAEELMIDVYLSLHRAVTGGATVLLDHDWIVSTALRQVLGHEPDGENDALTARERAALELHLVDGRDIDTVALTLGLTSAEVVTSLARYDDHSQFSTDLVADLLQRSELWLDDTTRRRARAAMNRGQRPPKRLTTDEPRRRSPLAEPPQQSPPSLVATEDTLRPPHRTIIATVCAVTALLAVAMIWILPGDEPSVTARVAPVRSTPADEPLTAATGASKPAAAVTSGSVVSPSLLGSSGSSSAPVASATSSGSVGQAAPAPLGSPPAGGVRTPVAQPGFVLGDVLPGFEANGASEQIAPATAGRFELWAEPGASRTSGRWLAVTTIAYTPSRSAILPGGSREMIGGGAAVRVTTPDGFSEFTVQPIGGGQFSLTGGGYTADELRQLAAGITLPRGEPAFDPALDTLRSDLEPLVTAPSQFGDLASQVTGGERRWASYLSTDQSQFVTVTTRATTPNDLLTSEFLLPASADTFAPSAGRTLQAGPLTLSVSGAPLRTDGARSESSVTWHDGPETVTISGNAGLNVLLAASPSVRRATSQEWTRLFQTVGVVLPGSTLQRLRGHMVRIGRTTFADTSRWTISISDDPVGVRFEVRSHSAAGIMGEAAFETVPPTPVSEYVSMSCTLLVVAINDPGAATGVRISLAGSSPVTVPLVPVEGAGLYAAGYAFSEVAPYTVELVDPTGATVRSIDL